MDLVSSFGRLTLTAHKAMFWFAQAEAPSAGGGAPAVGPAAASKAAESPAWVQFVPLVVFGLIFYFLILRPQSQRSKKHKAFLESLGVGSRVVLNSGIFGKITALEGNEAKIEIADRVVVRVLRSQIAGLETNAAEAVADATAGK